MLLSEIRDWLKTKTNSPNWYIGKIDATKEQCIGIYNTQGPAPNIALGGLANTSYATKAISILVHWGNNANIAEEKAQEIYNIFFGQGAVINNTRAIKFDMRTDEPVSVGTDDNGIYEYVVNLIIYYER
ncbi:MULTISPECIES: minor capsid protein [Clostridium]|uniref:minor capsid protein n=1 Tax=Clostridium TaxID=1485 RepID=UPI00069E022D|nr:MULTISPECIES: minor capsid protein [Clostridium]KOF56618.1 hypothetical protein AGR56_07750 [Clostridium sp. DMHC 10]MCD2348470.1 minor capsid protein [Clostridium guangxiense]